MKLKLNSNSYIFDLFSLSLKVWCKFIKFEEVFVNNWAYKKSFSNKSYVFAFWHDEIFPLTYFYRNRGIYAIVSPSRDGEILAGVLKRWGYNLFRGSSDKTPIKLLKEIIKKSSNKKIMIAIAVDGPRGPRHKVKKGAIYLAHKIGAFIVPVRVNIFPSIKINSWDRFQIPLLGAKCKIVLGQPYNIRYKKLTSEKIFWEVKALEHRLNNL